MRHLFTFLGLLFLTIIPCMAYDHIIFRNGRETDAILHQMTDSKITYSYIGDINGNLHEVSSKEVYMVFVEKHGNVYFTLDGKHFSGEPKRANAKRYDVIYLVRGAEIAADGIRVTENDIHYSVPYSNSGIKVIKGGKGEAIISKSEVFMIRYRNGMSDIITPFEIENEKKDASKEQEITDTLKNKSMEQQFIVIFHSVVKGDNLQNISTKYNVTSDQIVEWNDLPKKTNPNSQLTIGMQLMIYQPK